MPNASDPPARSPSRVAAFVDAPGIRTVLAFCGVLVLIFVAAFVIGRLTGPVAPDLRKPGPPGAPQPLSSEGNHNHRGLGPIPAPTPVLTLTPGATAPGGPL